MGARVITMLTDFGSASPYPGEMKLVLAALTDAALVDISHDVPRHDVRTGAYLLRAAAAHASAGTVHLAVIDPGVGTARRALILRSGGQDFVGPDNGLLLPAARRVGALRAFVITDEALIRGVRSRTFHGRDLFAPAAGRLAEGTPPEALGAPAPEVVDLDLGQGRSDGRSLIGTVIYVDPFGNVVTDISAGLLPPEGRRVDVRLGRRRLRATVRATYGVGTRGALVVLRGSDDLVEIAIREGDAARRLGVRPGIPVSITKS
jgi:S-adenosyl-L-methionine hydrolase (adenosine-forming)